MARAITVLVGFVGSSSSQGKAAVLGVSLASYPILYLIVSSLTALTGVKEKSAILGKTPGIKPKPQPEGSAPHQPPETRNHSPRRTSFWVFSEEGATANFRVIFNLAAR